MTKAVRAVTFSIGTQPTAVGIPWPPPAASQVAAFVDCLVPVPELPRRLFGRQHLLVPILQLPLIGVSSVAQVALHAPWKLVQACGFDVAGAIQFVLQSAWLVAVWSQSATELLGISSHI